MKPAFARIVTMKVVITILVLLIAMQFVANLVTQQKSRATIFSSVTNQLQGAATRVTRQGGAGGETVCTTVASNGSMAHCPIISPRSKGRVAVDTQIASWGQIEANNDAVTPGGRHMPPDCEARSRVAVIIPYRDREAHLKIFLKHIHPFLQRQQLDYGIYVVELATGIKFNRAMLMNIGFVEAAKIHPYQCFVFHDVDLIPEDDRNLYSCPELPRHMSVAVDTLNYKLRYLEQFGGVSAINKEQFIKINGFSNVFFGWGGEDDDMYKRIIYNNLSVTRYSPEIGRYKMLTHKKDTANPERFHLLQLTNMRRRSDGLNSLKYKVLRIDYTPLFTRIVVTFNETNIMKDERIHALAKEAPQEQANKPANVTKKPQRPEIISLVPVNGTAPGNLTTPETLVYSKNKP